MCSTTRATDSRATPTSIRETVRAIRRQLEGADDHQRLRLPAGSARPRDRTGRHDRRAAIDSFLAKSERRALAAALNRLLASRPFASWRTGATLDVGSWLTRGPDGRTPAAIVSVAHLDDEERALVLGVVLEELLTWVRAQPGTQRLRALVVFDEVYGFLPPHPRIRLRSVRWSRS